MAYLTARVYRRVFETMEQKIREGTQRDCFAVQYLKIAETEQFDENQKFFAGIFISMEVN